MHWRQLVYGSRLYREQYPSDSVYDEYVRTNDHDLPKEPWGLGDARRHIEFINRWATRSPLKAEQLQAGFRAAWPHLRGLNGQTIEQLALTGKIPAAESEPIQKAFDAIATCGARNESTGASKILHANLPRLFVMWDMRIAAGYGIYRDVNPPRPNGHDYASTFLPRITSQLREAVQSYVTEFSCGQSDAISELRKLNNGRSIAKMIDEYNFAKFTLSHDALWVAALPADKEVGR